MSSESITRSVLKNAGSKLLCALDLEHSGVKETPFRYANAMCELLSGYWDNPENYVKVFDNVESSSMIVMSHIHFVSLCEHHMLPFIGTAHIGYIPNPAMSKVIGASKLIRIFRCFSNRLQVQERIGEQVVDFLEKSLNAEGVICNIAARHMCISERGAKSVTSRMVTTAVRGAFRSDGACRDEFYKMVKLGGECASV